MTESTTNNGNTDDEPSKPDEEILYQLPSSEGQTDRRKKEVVELDIKRMRKILDYIDENYGDLEHPYGGDPSVHVVGHICDGWEKMERATLQENEKWEIPDFIDAEAGEDYVFRHFSAVPDMFEKKEMVSPVSGRTVRASRISNIKEKQKTTDRDRLYNLANKIEDAIGHTKSDVTEEFKQDLERIQSKVWDKADQLDDEEEAE